MVRLCWPAVLMACVPAFGWNNATHKLIAAAAWDRLTPDVQAKAALLLAQHPDFAHFQAAGADMRSTFAAAAIWADDILRDPRFYDQTRRDAAPTPLLAGFPDMGRHGSWHYHDIVFSTDGTAVKQQAEPHALSELRRMLAAPPSAYNLVWILHIVADVHQPMHATTRFLASQPNGDKGGNFVMVRPNGNLHYYWDAILGRRETLQIPAEPGTLDPAQWLQESFELARDEAYTFGNITGSRDAPIQLPRKYAENARRVARNQAGRASTRLAVTLSRWLQ